MNLSKNIKSTTPQSTSIESGTEIGRNGNVGRNSGDRIPPYRFFIFLTGECHGIVKQKLK